MTNITDKLENNESVIRDIEIKKLFTIKFRITDFKIKKKWRRLLDSFSKIGR